MTILRQAPTLPGLATVSVWIQQESAMRKIIRRHSLSIAAGASMMIAPLSPATAQDAKQPSIGASSPLPAEPKTPEQLFDSVLLTLQLNRPDVARSRRGRLG